MRNFTFRLEVADSDCPRLCCSLIPVTGPGFRFFLFQKTHYANVQVLSPCCHEGPAVVQRLNFIKVCAGCSVTPWDGTSVTLFGVRDGKWALEPHYAEDFESLFEGHADVLMAGLLAGEARDIISQALNRAASLHLLSPEGNLRGSLPLTLERQYEIAQNVFEYLDIEESGPVRSIAPEALLI